VIFFFSMNSPRFDCQVTSATLIQLLDTVQGCVCVCVSLGCSCTAVVCLTYLLAYLRVFNVFSHDAIPGEIVAIYCNHKHF